MITYRLADSLPAQAVTDLEAELRSLPPERRSLQRRRRIEELADAGHGSCVLRVPQIAELVIENWRHYAGTRYELMAYVVMPNHVHVLVRVYDGVSLPRIVQAWKGYTGKKIKELLAGTADRLVGSGDPGTADRLVGIGDHGTADRLVGTGAEPTLGAPSPRLVGTGAEPTLGAPSPRLAGAPRLHAPRLVAPGAPGWHREFWDRFIRDERHLQAAREYIAQNPVKAGLVARPEDWLWAGC